MDLHSEDSHPIDRSRTKNSALWEYHDCSDLGSIIVNGMHTKTQVITELEQENAAIFRKYNPVSLKIYDEVTKSFDTTRQRWRTTAAMEG